MLAAPELELGEQGAEQVGWKLEVTEDGDQPAGRRTGGGWGSGPGGVPGEALVFLKHSMGEGGLLLPMRQRNRGLHPFRNRL